MEMINTILTYGLLTSLLLAAIIIASLYIQPRIWMQDLPKEVRQSLAPKTRKENRQTLIVLILFFGILFTLPTIAVTEYYTKATLMQAWHITYSVYFIFNLTDLLIIDWLLVCTITPEFIKVKGVDNTVYKNYGKHLRDFMKGSLIITVPSFLNALLAYYIN